MLGYLILIFTVIPIVELAILIKVGNYMGVGFTVAVVIITGIVGAYLARFQGFLTVLRIQEEINNGRMPADKMLDGILILFSGILLITPGFLTDIIGFMGLIPYTRNLFKRWLGYKINNMINNGQVINIRSFNSY